MSCLEGGLRINQAEDSREGIGHSGQMIDLTRVSCRVLVEMVVDEMASNIRNKQEKNHAPCL